MSDETKTETTTPQAPEAPPPPPPRTRQQIRVDYTNACAQLGELRFNRECIEQTERAVMNQIDVLRREEMALPPEAKKPPTVKMAVVPPVDDGT